MNPILRLREWWTRRKLRRSIQRIREHLAAFGYDTSKMSDDEVVDAVHQFGAALRRCGLSAQELLAAMSRIALILNQAHTKTGTE